MELNGKTAIVTGAASGIGREMALALLKNGCKVAVIDIDESGLNILKSEYPCIEIYNCDLTDYEQVENTINQVFFRLKKIDYLINNAGVIHNEPLVSFSESGVKKHSLSSWEKVTAVNLGAVFNVTVNAAEKMLLKRTKGIIINISSISSKGNAGQTAYSASKAAVNALTVTWAKELGPMGIRVTAISPGFIDTDSTHNNLKPEKEKELKRKIPIKKFGNVKNIIDAIFFIIENDFFNGRVLEIDGGMEIG